MRTFNNFYRGRVWKLLWSYKDLEAGDIISEPWGPGKTKQGLYKVKKIENSVAILTTTYNVDVEYDFEGKFDVVHILNPDIKDEWINNFNKKAVLNF